MTLQTTTPADILTITPANIPQHNSPANQNGRRLKRWQVRFGQQRCGQTLKGINWHTAHVCDSGGVDAVQFLCYLSERGDAAVLWTRHIGWHRWKRWQIIYSLCWPSKFSTLELAGCVKRAMPSPHPAIKTMLSCWTNRVISVGFAAVCSRHLPTKPTV